MTIPSILYGTLGCHLCDYAREILRPLVQCGRLRVDEVDIIDNADLEDRYGIRIPVLHLIHNGSELDWPFDYNSAEQFLTAQDIRNNDH